jgi:hypothetical protein
MSRFSPSTIAAVATLALTAAFGGAYYAHTHEAPAKRRHWPKPTPPPPPSPIYLESDEHAMDEAEIAAEAEGHIARVALAVERALLSRDLQAREAAFSFLLPELVQIEPDRVVEMVAAQEPGEPRDTLRTELARQWIERDRAAAVGWMKSLAEDERRASGRVAMDEIRPWKPEEARRIADELGIDPQG